MHRRTTGAMCVCTTNSALLCILVPAHIYCTISAVTPPRQHSLLFSTATVPLPVHYQRTTALHFNLSADLLFRQATCLWARISFLLSDVAFQDEDSGTQSDFWFISSLFQPFGWIVITSNCSFSKQCQSKDISDPRVECF